MDKPHLTFLIFSRLILLLSLSDLLIKLFYMSHGHDFSLKSLCSSCLVRVAVPDVESAPSISAFKPRLKMHLYSMAFPEL